MTRPAPLSRATSLKTRLGAIVGISVLVATVVATVGTTSRVTPWLVIPVAVALAMLVTQWLSTGMTAPLRQMTDAAGRMARGDFGAEITATGRDEVATLAKAFTSMAADLRDVDSHRRDLVATVSHELRTPAAALRALLENMADGVTPADEEGLRAALGQAERLSDLLGDLLALSRIDAGLVELRLVEIRVADLVAEAGREVTLSGRPLRLQVTVEPPDLTVRAERARVKQAVTNLLDNAARHTGAGQVRVHAEARGSEWTLDVSDDGPGIRPGERERIFERYGTAAAGGTGLGLAVTRWVAEVHGGRVAAIEPEPGQSGARLRITLPRSPVQPAPRHSAAATRPAGTTPLDPAPIAPGVTMPTLDSPTASDPKRPGGHGPTSSPVAAPPPVPQPAGALHRPSPYSSAVAATRYAPGTAHANHQGPLPYPAPPGSPPPPILDGLFGALWPDRGAPARPGLLAGALGTGALAALLLPGRPMGLAVTLVLLAGGATIAAAAPRRSPWTWAALALAVALSVMPTLRAADWLMPLTLLAGAVLVVIALAPVGSLAGLIATAAAWPMAGLRGLPWLGRMLARRPAGSRAWVPVLRTTALSALALVVFGSLFASADAVFGHWVDAVIPDLSIDAAIQRTFILLAVFGVTLAAVFLGVNPLNAAALAVPAPRPVRRTWEWAVPVGLVVALYAAFILAQASAWLGGHDFVQRTTGLTYADYVHQGFGELSVATVLTIGVIALAARKAPRADPGDRLLLRVLLGALALLTLAVVASALWRMKLYQDAFGYTTTRLIVDVFEIWVALVVVMLLIAGIRLQGKWIPRAAGLAGAALILGLGLMNPDAFVARANAERFAQSGRLDTGYLSSLSEDAVPALVAGLPRGISDCVLSEMQPRLAGNSPGDALSFNIGRERAQEALAAAPAVQSRGGCAAGTLSAD